MEEVVQLEKVNLYQNLNNLGQLNPVMHSAVCQIHENSFSYSTVRGV